MNAFARARGGFVPARRRTGSERGVTLVEATVILAVASVLASILAPSVGSYLDQARQARAREDVQVIGTAINSFIDDTGEHMFLRNGSDGGTDRIPPTRADAQRVDAQGIRQPMPVRQFAHTLEMRRLHRRQHSDRHPGGARALPHRFAVGVEFGGIKVTVGVDPRHRVDPCVFCAGVHVHGVAAYHRSRQRGQSRGAAR